ncbi:MAG TPA: hypothetical protein VFV99_27295 [Kofleriaceae bacterium]|nr:hypothetical protein [Kofleriaceae bacterium]
MRVWLLVAALAACSSESSDVIGPFSGANRKFIVDRIEVPVESTDVTAYADDLDGDGADDNQFGNVTSVLATTNDLSTHMTDMIASGAITSIFMIYADNFTDDDHVGVLYLGSADDSPNSAFAGGRFEAGGFSSNRTRDTRAPGRSRVHLPIYVNADPLALQLEGMEVDLTPDGGDGYDGFVRGGIAEDLARQAAFEGLVQMAETEPERHIVFLRGIDKNHDDVITREEVDDSVIALLVTADIALFDGDHYGPHPSTVHDSLSVGFKIHLKLCPGGICTPLDPPVNLCRDRWQDGGETDIDCGGPCQPCAAAKHCNLPTDCQSNACDSGSCRAPSCTDGVRDGYESDIDCGGSCPKCAAGLVCAADSDCANNNCDNGVASLGTCAGP